MYADFKCMLVLCCIADHTRFWVKAEYPCPILWVNSIYRTRLAQASSLSNASNSLSCASTSMKCERQSNNYMHKMLLFVLYQRFTTALWISHCTSGITSSQHSGIVSGHIRRSQEGQRDYALPQSFRKLLHSGVVLADIFNLKIFFTLLTLYSIRQQSTVWIDR